MGEIKVEQKDSIVTIVFSRPDKLNSVTEEMLNDFSDKVSKYTNDPSIAAIVFTGEGERSFSVGFDLEMITNMSDRKKKEFFKKLEKIIRLIRSARNCITIAAINGYAIGFGAMVAVACDFRFFAENSGFRFPEIDLGVFPGAGASSNLIHIVGPARAKDILLTARTVQADECLRIGLADRLYSREEILDKALEFATELVKKNRIILLRTKSLVDSMTGRTVGGADETESTYLDEWISELPD
ncbi:MAG: enoyl-CoA hydratase/isomerase family protein [Candidatus Thorarchaeota archaeon]